MYSNMVGDTMDKRITKELENQLIQIKDKDNLVIYLEDTNTIVPYKNFVEYFFSLEKVKNIKLSEIIQQSGIERTYAYQILNGTKQKPGRDKIIRLCIGAGLTLAETIRALEIAQEGTLYARNKRDVIIAFAINKSCDVNDTNELLMGFNEEVLK